MEVRQDGPVQGGPPPGWYGDPWRVSTYRWWDGAGWTGHVAAGNFPTVSMVYAPPKPVLPRARDNITGGWIALLGFVSAIVFELVFEYAALAAGASKHSLAIDFVGHIGLWLGLAMAAYVVTHRVQGGTLADLGLRKLTGQEIGLGVAVGFGGLFAVAQLTAVLRNLLPPGNRSVRSYIFVAPQPSAAELIVIALLVCVGAPFFEELFFRGVIQGVLTTRIGAIPAIFVQAVLFGSAHFQIGMTANEAIVRITAVSILGCGLGWLRHYTGRLGAGMVAHATNNGIIVLLTFLVLYGR